jgi:hypothetical protein
MKNIVYDKVSWHFPEGKNCPSLEVAKKHFIVIMEWLNKNELLSEEGIEYFNLGIDSDFSLTSSMLTEIGNEILDKSYKIWLKSINYNSEINWTEIIFDHFKTCNELCGNNCINVENDKNESLIEKLIAEKDNIEFFSDFAYRILNK